MWSDENKRAFSAETGAAWVSRPGTGGAYLVELFRRSSATHDRTLAEAQDFALSELRSSLIAVGVSAEMLGKAGSLVLHTRVTADGDAGALTFEQSDTDRRLERFQTAGSVVSFEPMVHHKALRAIEANPMVRQIVLPPIVTPSASSSFPLGRSAPVAIFERDQSEPASAVGIIDGGVSDTAGPWIGARWGQLAEQDRELKHGSFIAGLLIAAGTLNWYINQPHGCRIFDIDVLPDDPAQTGLPFDGYYPGGIPDFMDEIEAAIEDFRRNHGVRVFNFSMNFTAPGERDRYGYVARRLDYISATYDVIVVISAGNLSSAQFRTEWSSDHTTALASLVSDTSAVLAEPGESLYNVSVSALNPPGLDNQVPFALARYSKRGPGLKGAIKPDFGHVGGSGSPTPAEGSGLISVDEFGTLIAEAGTSYAAPLVARALADLDSLIDGDVSREVLLALLVHYARTPELFGHKDFKRVARDLVGFGVPISAEEMLQRADSEITLVVNSILRPKEDAELEFVWPEALVRGGKCRGDARLTVVARPLLAYEHGAERVRMNVGARLMQQQRDGGFRNRLYPVNAPRDGLGDPHAEKELIDEALKWQVVKSFHRRMTGVGFSSNWKLAVDYLPRFDEDPPESGVQFAAILTIADPTGVAPVFQQMRQELVRQNIETGDIRTSVQTRTRA
ncbi:S8 family serine peptidase [Salinibacterium sp. SWN167]|uniref:S8 family serine peptidase n=1 Tax=Salinibacterium sp. SWN167 TaxID=2792054 RepID=UPI0018CE4EEC|nr:S8 family serine peptidase [Salinibacterium sp. SWN167]MBH0082226.1 S8 family serine peptidase [Salinibacterium sp. SWN167]